MDLKNVLSDNENGNSSKINEESSVKVHKKPIQLRDIENRSSSKTRYDSYESKDRMTELLNKEKDTIYKQTWNKLDRGLKINRLKEFITREVKQKKLTKVQELQLSELLLSACSNNKMNRINDIIYNHQEGFIEQLKNLNFKDGIFHLKTIEQKQSRSSAKPKSNIDRFLKSGAK